ncbi:co-chaperone DjlA [Sideroxydans lithotrophicus]|uniref:Heat shock protein DnaJ domain protein n=1 Tax=Sideroxydans lithotrophicus (strain ES-1) TaxID=580332 RepID=D5CTS1_SIDLE|nr:co-chaperone DjlA [Sideroxydans lithotrophicus]ADE12233.1 heat shock protein DnaJ domain protein [Sideroxydans lithotrophicus ES-1]
MFKLIGIVVGYFLFGFWGGLSGFFIGSFFDRMRAYGTGGMNPLHNALRQAVFLETVFISMGKLAKADGHVSQDEIDHVEQFMQKLGMSAEHRLRAIALFKQGADAAFDITPTYARFMSVCGHTRNLKDVLLVYLIVMALADGHFHPAEEALLIDIAARLGYDQASFRQMMDMVLNQGRFAGQQVDHAAALDDAYKALGVSKDSTDAEIKRAYRKLMSQYHPDKLIGQGMPEDMVAMATEQAKEIQVAYDLIKKSRNI